MLQQIKKYGTMWNISHEIQIQFNEASAEAYIHYQSSTGIPPVFTWSHDYGYSYVLLHLPSGFFCIWLFVNYDR
jgi:hypothetical protein